MSDKWFEIEEDFRLLKSYLAIYIQLLPECVECGGKKLRKPQLPTFEYFKKTFDDRRYSLYIPHYKETKIIVDGKITNVYTHGMGTSDGIAYRGYNYWMGCKFYPPYNFDGDYTICEEELQKHLK